MRRAAVLVLCVGGGLAVATAPAAPGIDPDNPPLGLFADDWYAVTFQDRKCGYMHSAVVRKPGGNDGSDVIETTTEMRITLGRGGQTVRIGTVERSTETIAGDILGFSSETDMSLMSVRMSGVVKDGRVTVTTRQYGQTTTNTYPLPAGALMNWGSYREQRRRGLAVGTRYTLPAYAPSMSADRVLPTTFEIVSREPVDLYGRVVEAYKTRQTMKAPGLLGPMNVESIVWLNDRFVPVKLEMEVAQMRIVAILCDKAIATRAVDPPELMADTLIPVRLPEGAGQARSITYRLSRKGGPASRPSAALPALPDTAMQRVTREADGSLLVKVTRCGAVAENPVASKPAPADLDKLRAATAYANTDDPEIQRLAREAAGDEKDPVKKVARLRAFVSRYVETKDLSVGFATAGEVARSRQGDCSEHAVLLAALARACGLPARAVSGIVYAPRFAGRNDVFVWHMWTQVYAGGRWIDTDPALEQDDLDATHIAMSLVSLDDAALGEMALPIWNLIGRLQIDVVEVRN
jgi:hypothetical protein